MKITMKTTIWTPFSKHLTAISRKLDQVATSVAFVSSETGSTYVEVILGNQHLGVN